jgi:peroxiredoxin
MSKRPSSAAIAAMVILAGFTVWITMQAKTLERDLDGSSQKISLLGKPAPDFNQTALDGHAVSLANSHGRHLVLAFLASWNNASHTSMAMLRDLYDNNQRPDSNFDIVGISLDDDRAAAQSLSPDSKNGFPIVLDKGRAIANAYQIRTLPTILLVDTDGKVTYGVVGPSQRGQMELAQRMGLQPRNFRMDMRAPNAGRGN